MKKIFKIPLVINSKLGTNKIYAGVHWRTRNKDKEDMLLLVRSIVGIKQKPFDKPVCLKMAFKSKLDVSNHSYLFKMIEDSLVKCGILQDDNDKFVRKNVMEKQKEFVGVIVEVEEIKGDLEK